MGYGGKGHSNALLLTFMTILSTYKVDNIIPILEMRGPRFRDVKCFRSTYGTKTNPPKIHDITLYSFALSKPKLNVF